MFKFMKKKQAETAASYYLLQKLLRGMKMTFFLLLAFLMQVSARTYSQQMKVSLDCRNEEMLSVLRKLEKQTNLFFFFNDKAMETGQKVSLSVKEEALDAVLEKIFAGKFQWEQVDNMIVVKPRDARSQQQQQMVRVTGLVTDENGQPLPGVTVLLKGTTLGAATDPDGKYMLMIPKGEHILSFSMVGMEDAERKAMAAGEEIRIDVVMKNLVSELEDVVVTGYFNKSKNSFTGAVTQAKREELRKFGNVNLIQALSMVDPSFKIKENNLMGSDPNTLPDFFVRGESSFMGESNVPTFIVDGYEVTLQRVFDMDMDRIESITVLKDASATILYGSRAANGVVVIETRRPEGGRLQVSYSNRTSLAVADLSDYNLMDAREKLEYEQKSGLFDMDYVTHRVYLEQIKQNVERGVNTDWLAQPVRNAVSHAHSLYIDGGTDAVVYGLGMNYNRKTGVMKKSYREVFGASFDLTYRIRDKVSVRNSFEFQQTNVQNSPYGSFSLYASANPYNPIYDDEGKLIAKYASHMSRKDTEPQYTNPLYNATLPYKDESAISTITDNLDIDWWLLPELRFKASVSLTKTTNTSDKYVSPDHTDFLDQDLEPSEKGEYKKGNGKGFSYNINATLNYNLQKNRHTFFSGVGMNLVQNRTINDSYTAVGFLDGRFNEVWFGSKFEEGSKPSGSEEEDRMAGFFANINYSFDDRYFADFSGRLDGSSKYGKDKRFAPLWSVGVGWNINREHFLESAGGWLTRLTLRASIGETGNQNFDPYQARTTLKYIQDQIYYDGLGAEFMAFGNNRLEWQTSLKRNIGLDLEVMQRRLSLRFDYYSDRTNGLLLPVSVTPSLGFTSYTENFGEQRNKGYEFDLNAVLIRHDQFDFAVNFSGTHNENRITKISSALRALNEENNASEKADQTAPIAMYEEGESINAIKAVRSLGINPASGKELFLTRDGRITEKWDYKDKVVVGCTDPKLEGNIGANIMWKNWQLNVLMRYSFGAQQYNSTLAERVEGVTGYANADKRVLDERWQEPGNYSFYKDIADRTVSNATSRFVQDYNYLEMSNLSLSYRLPHAWLKKIGFSNVRIGLNTSDLFYVSTIKRERGLDYPFAREFTFSLNLNF